MESHGSISRCLAGVRNGDERAVQDLWEQYYERMVRLAAGRLRGRPPGIADEEDVALSAFDSFCEASRRGRFPKLADRYGLWRLLLRMTVRKVVDAVRYEDRDKRGGPAGGNVAPEDVEQVVGTAPTPEFAAAAAEAFENRLASLEPKYREVALLRFEGYSVAEVAERLERPKRTIERRLEYIRTKWTEEETRT